VFTVCWSSKCVNPFDARRSKLLLFEGFSCAVLIKTNIFNFWHLGALALTARN